MELKEEIEALILIGHLLVAGAPRPGPQKIRALIPDHTGPSGVNVAPLLLGRIEGNVHTIFGGPRVVNDSN